jgi:hypothetical protein
MITKFVVAPCHNCFDQVNDLSEAYMLGVKALSLKEIICEIMIVPAKFKLDQHRKNDVLAVLWSLKGRYSCKSKIIAAP